MSASHTISNGRKARDGARRRNEASSSKLAERFTLSGPSLILDPRVHAYRQDIADIALAGQLFAPHYARPMVRACGLLMPAPVRTAPSDSGDTVSELLPGEEFGIIDINAHWAWGYCRADHVVGYVEAAALLEMRAPTHIVVEARAPILSSSDPLSPSLAPLPMGSRIHGEEKGAMLAIESGYVPLSHLRGVDEQEDDPAAVAQRLLGAPYARGGRTWLGLDCSGLVQLALALCGIPAPRDADQQRALGERLGEGVRIERGDLIFWEEYVGLMLDDRMVIHASPEIGKVTVRLLDEVCGESSAETEWRRLRR